MVIGTVDGSSDGVALDLPDDGGQLVIWQVAATHLTANRGAVHYYEDGDDKLVPHPIDQGDTSAHVPHPFDIFIKEWANHNFLADAGDIIPYNEMGFVLGALVSLLLLLLLPN